MRRIMKGVLGSWHKELLVLFIGMSVLALAPAAFASECKPGTDYHYHDGADHCDSGGAGCEVVCVED